MNSAIACPAATVVRTRTPLLQRLQGRLSQAWLAWRRQTRLHAELRSLEGLSDATLRDIGMSERVLQQHAPSALDYERGRW